LSASSPLGPPYPPFALPNGLGVGVTIKETATGVKGTLAETFLTIQVADKKWFVCEAVLPENIKQGGRLTPN